MNPVAGGFTPHKIRGDGDYEAQKRAAMAQSGSNSYIQGVQSVFEDGAGKAMQKHPTYGNVNQTTNDLMQGRTSNFAQKDMPGNQPLDDIPNQTGSAELDTSSTMVPQEDPQEMETDALDRRLQMMSKAGQGLPGLNDRSRGA